MSQLNRVVGVTLLWIALLGAGSAGAEEGIVVLPESHHQQFRTYGLWIDQQSTLVFRDAGRAWAAIGGSVALVEFGGWSFSPQLVVHGSANAAFRINSSGDTLLTETDDARVGLSWDMRFSPDWRGALTWTHQSGHISDNVPDPELIGPNLGNEILAARVVHDFGERARVGGSLRPYLGTDPGMKTFGADQFGEYFLGQPTEDAHRFRPFVAMGLEEYGRHAIDVSFHVQAGVAGGGHFKEEHHSALRAVVGYYHGQDPQLKYYQFFNRHVGFAYAGVMLDF